MAPSRSTTASRYPGSWKASGPSMPPSGVGSPADSTAGGAGVVSPGDSVMAAPYRYSGSDRVPWPPRADTARDRRDGPAPTPDSMSDPMTTHASGRPASMCAADAVRAPAPPGSSDESAASDRLHRLPTRG